jgi:glutamine---fructose-6-phosphate transaminase (isomerizing)
MNLNDTKYLRYALCREMIETIDIVKNFNPDISRGFVSSVKARDRIFITGEGSSRIFPAKHFIYQSLKYGADFKVNSDGALQTLEYVLDDCAVFGASNSGKTNELLKLFSRLKNSNHNAFFGITATAGSPVDTLPSKSVVLSCGKENAVAATKSVVEQALFFESLLCHYLNVPMIGLDKLSENIRESLQCPIDRNIIDTFIHAPVIYFSGRNNGVAEELTLKTNEITRKKSLFLEGTYGLHGIEEVMNKGEVMVIIDPFEEEEAKFQEVLAEGAGIKIIAIASRDTRFPTITIPDAGRYKNYAELAAGWNLLAETGIAMGIDVDRPQRARKIGNEGTVSVVSSKMSK